MSNDFLNDWPLQNIYTVTKNKIYADGSARVNMTFQDC